MTRELMMPNKGTPFGKWIRDNCRDSKETGLLVSNLDYVIYDHGTRQLMLLEEKFGLESEVGYGQRSIFRELNYLITQYCRLQGTQFPDLLPFEYWGIFQLNMEGGIPHDGMLLNGTSITVQQLIRHINFEKKAVESKGI